ncbi:uncharacterized protein A1O9_12408 [Exophiala aquamarina CBS 119918]|uniref:Uncharacterized protein n=1 Tax=Exophiala aquamarina CBS 119918 TaxID=1182545 RepID=A0A072NV40_9EURO|nr:uncharacterized protein A1O9_12408 [Exophiala aquamarina CBS 119918]KEF51491.1 hypothetical protein A1O9_12408 [Exophiala aquamarina CBS 119918]
MATLAPVSTAMRQPFGVLNESKIRSMQSLKNRQNALTPSSTSLKRRAPSPESSDSENVDPNMLDSLHKRKRSMFDDDVSVSKPRYSLNTISSVPKPCLATRKLSTPRLNTFVKPSVTPASAPAAAGRSPTRKRQGLLESRKRFAPPSFGVKPPSLSMSAALSGTLANRKTKKSRPVATIEDSKPNSWFFDIYEESEETQDYRMNEWTMTQSAYGLDISDDESKSAERLDRGKENVDPNEISVPVTRSMAAAAAAAAATALNTKPISRTSRKGKDDMSDDEPRTPLGDLNPSEFYAEGLDATSVVLVHDDAPESEAVHQEDVTQESEPKSTQQFTFSATSTLTAKAIEALDAPSIDQILSAPTLEWDGLVDDSASTVVDLDINTEATSQDVEIWESESAKDENEKVEFGILAESDQPRTPIDDENVFALQEL